MRQGELISLNWKHINLKKRTAFLPDTKNGESRGVPLSTTAADILRSLPRSINDQVFPGVTCEAVKRAFIRACRRAHIEDFHFHDLRHTFATRLVQAGVELYKVQRLLGHKSPMMTQRYAHHYPESLRDGVEILDRIKPTSQIITVGLVGTAAEAASC